MDPTSTKPLPTLAVAVALLLHVGCDSPRPQADSVKTTARDTAVRSVPPAASPTLLEDLKVALRRRNPRIENVAFLHIKAFDYGREYVAVGWGVRADLEFHGSFEDELFAVLLLDRSLTHIRRVVDILPTPRWRDFDLAVQALTGDSIIVTGRGATYGDAPIRRAYAWPDSL